MKLTSVKPFDKSEDNTKLSTCQGTLTGYLFDARPSVVRPIQRAFPFVILPQRPSDSPSQDFACEDPLAQPRP